MSESHLELQGALQALSGTLLDAQGAANALIDSVAIASGTAVLKPASPAAYTQTYATVDRTHANPTAAAVATTAATNTVPYGFSQAQANALPVAINALIADLADVKQVVNGLIDDLRALGVVG